MRSNKLVAWAIFIITMVVPFNIAYLNDAGGFGIKIFMMVLTMTGIIASLFIGLKQAQ